MCFTTDVRGMPLWVKECSRTRHVRRWDISSRSQRQLSSQQQLKPISPFYLSKRILLKERCIFWFKIQGISSDWFIDIFQVNVHKQSLAEQIIIQFTEAWTMNLKYFAWSNFSHNCPEFIFRILIDINMLSESNCVTIICHVCFLIVSSNHQQQWHSLYRLKGSLSSTMKGVTYLCSFCVKKRQIYSNDY